MTFIVGMRCSDGLVLAGDSLESDSVTKRYKQKVHAINIGNEWGICWGAAGTAYTCDKFSDRVKAVVGNGSFDRGEMEKNIEACLDEIRQNYQSADSIQIVVGMFGRPMEQDAQGKPMLGNVEWHLYRGHSLSACLSPERDYCFAGMDVTLAGFVVANTYHRFAHVEYAERLATFSTLLMKQHADGVGGDSTVFKWTLGTNVWTPLLEREITAIEATFPTSDLDKAMSRFWLEHPGNGNVLDEMNGSMMRKILSKQSASQT